ncbi:MAG TPA: TolC family protein [Candidatus Binatia bacterium]|jgi:cobalt-zinc-cadmium efflux system outer membrane protein
MILQRILFTFVLCFLFIATPARAADFSLDLPATLQHALRENPELKAKRHSLGIAEGRARQAGLLFQNNPRFSVEVESQVSGKPGTTLEFNFLQELEIAGQRGYRYEAAEKNLAQAQLSVEDAERLVRLEVTRTFYNLLALQQTIADLKEVLAAQNTLMEVGQKRFDREDISILELNTLRLDSDQVRNELANKIRERLLTEKQLRLLLGFQEDGPLMAAGNLMDLLLPKTRDAIPDKQNIQACVLANRPDLKAAKLSVAVREAELRLARARRIPNISLGPRYKRDNVVNEHLVGGEISIPLPFFNRNQEEIATALANQNVSKVELEGRLLTAKQEVDSSYAKVALAKERLDAYGKTYLGDLEKMLALTRKAYESGEMTIFEFSITRDRFTQARGRSLDAALVYLQTVAELESQAPGCLQ